VLICRNDDVVALPDRSGADDHPMSNHLGHYGSAAEPLAQPPVDRLG
jgi:hypothetical protein